MIIHANITTEDYQNLFAMFNDWIIQNGSVAKLDFLAKKISKKELDSRLEHAEYLKELGRKILGPNNWKE